MENISQVLIPTFIMAYCTIQARIDRISLKYRFALCLIIFLLIYSIGLNHGQIVTIFVLIISVLFLCFKSNYKVLNISLFLLLYGTVIVLDYVNCNLLYLISGLTLDGMQKKYFIPFELYNMTVSCLFCEGFRYLLIQRWQLHKKIAQIDKKMFRAICLQLTIFISMLVVNIILGGYINYPPQMVQLNSLFFTVYFLCSCLILFYIYRLLQKEERLKAQLTEQQHLQEYAERLEALYEETREFRHDYANLMLTMRSYMEEAAWGELKQYFQERIEPFSERIQLPQRYLGHLKNLEVPELKGLLSGKCLQALYQGIGLTLNIPMKVRRVPMDILDFCRVVGIFLDNALEAAWETEEKKVEVEILPEQDALRLLFANDTKGESSPAGQLAEKGASSKPGHAGLGLHTARRILETHENAEWKVRRHGRRFEVTLYLTDEEE